MVSQATPEDWERRALDAEHKVSVYEREIDRHRTQLTTCTSTLRILESREPEYRRAIDKNRQTIQALEARISEILDLEGGLTDLPPLTTPPQLQPVVQAFLREYWRAKQKHGEMTMDGSMTGEGGAADDLIRLAALGEECGEVMELFTYDKNDSAFDEAVWAGKLFEELVQVMNVAGTWASWVWRQYGSTIPGPEQPAEPMGDEAGVPVPVEPITTPQPAVSGQQFLASVRELRGLENNRRPDRHPDTVGVDREERYWLLWHDEGVRCQVDNRVAQGELLTATSGRMVQLSRMDLAQYGVVAHD